MIIEGGLLIQYPAWSLRITIITALIVFLLYNKGLGGFLETNNSSDILPGWQDEIAGSIDLG